MQADTLQDSVDMENLLKSLLSDFYRGHNVYYGGYCGRVAYDSGEAMHVLDPHHIHEPLHIHHAVSPILIDDERWITRYTFADSNSINWCLEDSIQSFKRWRSVPAPERGRALKIFTRHIEEHKSLLAKLITIEMGKPIQESLGEVQEVIDVCDFAIGLSRQQYGLTMPSERPSHRLMEQWHPLGSILVITAFNFPMAVWAWNAAIALVCGNSIVWKPSEQTPLCALALHNLLVQSLEEANHSGALSTVIFGDRTVAQSLVADQRFSLVCATGSCAMGQDVATLCAQRMGRYLLELGGNNAMIVMPSCELDLAIQAIAFSALGTTGQRCTSLRRCLIHKDIFNVVVSRLRKVYASIAIGNPLNEAHLIGPLVSEQAVSHMQDTLDKIQQEGGDIVCGGQPLLDIGDTYVDPALVVIDGDHPILQDEYFSPILFLSKIESIEEGIDLNNAVPQGLSSSLFSNDIREVELFLSEVGSDCGLANINIGSSGAEIGGAFGGDKMTGGGRESGSDSWKQYMRRSTNTVNYGRELPLAQGIRFNLK